ncbi:hypothetical protein Amsp01_102580 [Amycolatopsis sp. NBRC 101858]|uniref:hypothetical protein n=1 Tax=Amycolatopsis sp. NBRC 101858 TaxID=3032200 RepID=UPI0024A10B30|nr:hypothetical protein [Amycolatopsis sp. NBRC 101858]GLY44235.1 hypothetical protein Amsp01_102580 [Amycolatopsis sp. NBRC 101858]
MRYFATAAGVLAAAVLVGGCTAAPKAQTPQPVPTTVTAEPVTATVTTTETVPTTVTSVVTKANAAPKTTRPKAEDCQTGGCLNAARGMSQEDVDRERDAWLATHPGWCAVGTTGAVAPC